MMRKSYHPSFKASSTPLEANGCGGASHSADPRQDVTFCLLTSGRCHKLEVSHSRKASSFFREGALIMSVLSPSPTGRSFLTTLATAGVFGLVLPAVVEVDGYSK